MPSWFAFTDQPSSEGEASPSPEPEPDSADPPSLAPSAVLGSAEAEYMDDGESVHSLADTIMDPGSNSNSDRTSALSSWRRAPIRPLGGHLEYECGGGTTTNLKSTCTGTTNRGRAGTGAPGFSELRAWLQLCGGF